MNSGAFTCFARLFLPQSCGSPRLVEYPADEIASGENRSLIGVISIVFISQ
jgi:hypothetical protein